MMSDHVAKSFHVECRWPDGSKTDEIVQVEVDLAGLARAFGTRAVHSRGGKAIEAGGLVVVRRVGGR